MKPIKLSDSMDFSSLWTFEDEIRNNRLTYAEADKKARQLRDGIYWMFRKAGIKTRRWVLKRQLRQYWNFSESCGYYCNVYYLSSYIDDMPEELKESIYKQIDDLMLVLEI